MGIRKNTLNRLRSIRDVAEGKVSDLLTERFDNRLSDSLTDGPSNEKVAFQGMIPNPLGDGSLLRVSVAVETEEDAGGERTRLRARVQAPVMQVQPAASDAPRLSYEAPTHGVPALIRRLPGGDSLLHRASGVREEIAARLPVVQPTGEEVTTVFDIDMNRKKLAVNETGLFPRIKERFAMVAGPDNWQVDQQEQATSEGFRGLVTIRSADKNSPIDVVAKVGVELRARGDEAE